MSIAISNSKNQNGKPNFSVFGLEKNNKRGIDLKNKVGVALMSWIQVTFNVSGKRNDQRKLL